MPNKNDLRLRIPFQEFLAIRDKASAKGMTISEFADSLLELSAAEAGMTLEDFENSVINRAAKGQTPRHDETGGCEICGRTEELREGERICDRCQDGDGWRG